jgi:hypothetical protein
LGSFSTSIFGGNGIGFPSSSSCTSGASSASTGLSSKTSYVTPYPGARILSTRKECSGLLYPK